ncbi:MAG: hypothetical protein HND48_07425 [Chloroflexi bacterium]|nr:hypothetical protein [Chloroflexota bacterium]
MLAGLRLEEVADLIDSTPAFNFAGGDLIAAALAPSAEVAARLSLPAGRRAGRVFRRRHVPISAGCHRHGGT